MRCFSSSEWQADYQAVVTTGFLLEDSIMELLWRLLPESLLVIGLVRVSLALWDFTGGYKGGIWSNAGNVELVGKSNINNGSSKRNWSCSILSLWSAFLRSLNWGLSWRDWQLNSLTSLLWKLLAQSCLAKVPVLSKAAEFLGCDKLSRAFSKPTCSSLDLVPSLSSNDPEMLFSLSCPCSLAPLLPFNFFDLSGFSGTIRFTSDCDVSLAVESCLWIVEPLPFESGLDVCFCKVALVFSDSVSQDCLSHWFSLYRSLIYLSMAALGEASPKLLSTYLAKSLSSLLVTPMYFLSPQSLSVAYSSHPFVWMTFSDKHLSWGCPLSNAFSSKEPAPWKWLYLNAGLLARFLRGFSGDRMVSVEVLFATLCFSLMSVCVVIVFPLILSSVSLLNPMANEATLGLLLFSSFLLRGRSLWQPSCFSINRESSEA